MGAHALSLAGLEFFLSVIGSIPVQRACAFISIRNADMSAEDIVESTAEKMERDRDLSDIVILNTSASSCLACSAGTSQTRILQVRR